jgi:Transglycosylase SLT domain
VLSPRTTGTMLKRMQARQAATIAIVSLALPVAMAAPADATAYLHLSAGDPSKLALRSVPRTYLSWYRQAAQTCKGLPWGVLAGIGEMESDHGQSSAAGVHSAANYAGAEGPMQFEPGTFSAYAVRADRAHSLSPYDPQDAIFTAARMLCANGAHGGSPSGIWSALFAYNHADWYPPQVMSWAARYTSAARRHRAAARHLVAPRHIAGPVAPRVPVIERPHVVAPVQASPVAAASPAAASPSPVMPSAAVPSDSASPTAAPSASTAPSMATGPTAQPTPSATVPAPSGEQPTAAQPAAPAAAQPAAPAAPPAAGPPLTAAQLSDEARQLASEADQLSAQARQLSDEARQLSADGQQMSAPSGSAEAAATSAQNGPAQGSPMQEAPTPGASAQADAPAVAAASVDGGSDPGNLPHRVPPPGRRSCPAALDTLGLPGHDSPGPASPWRSNPQWRKVPVVPGLRGRMHQLCYDK